MNTTPQSPPTPTVPRAVQELEALSPMGKAMLVADTMHRRAEAAGIAVREVSAEAWDEYDMGVYIGARRSAETPVLAAALGLDSRVVQPCVDPARSIEEFSAVIEGIRVRTQHTLPTAALAADEPVQVAS